jgi:hypothetical protein
MKGKISLAVAQILIKTAVWEDCPKNAADEFIQSILDEVRGGRPFDLEIGPEGLKLSWDWYESSWYLSEYTAEELKAEEDIRRVFEILSSFKV